jgi:hypothetical protein
MFRSTNINKLDNEIAKLIKESTNKSINQGLKIASLKPNPESPNIFFILPFVSIFSFLAGYYCKRITS